MNTIASRFENQQVSIESLQKNYRPLLKSVKELVGIVPHSDFTLEIWPTAFKSYNLLAATQLNFPISILKPIKSSIGLGMYVSSVASGCQYSVAHCCSFAIRRGLSPEKIAGYRTEKETAIVKVAASLGLVPHQLTKDQCDDLRTHFSEKEAHNIIMSISLIGFLNKFMDAMGIGLEDEIIEYTQGLLKDTGWTPENIVNSTYRMPKISTALDTDTFGTYMRILKETPGVFKLEKKWVEGVPDKYPETGSYLKEMCGYEFPFLKHIKKGRVTKAIAAVLKDNLNNETSKIGIDIKCLAGVVFAHVIGNKKLLNEAKILVIHHSSLLGSKSIKRVVQLTEGKELLDEASSNFLISDLMNQVGLSKKQAACITLARAVSDSPSRVNNHVLKEVVSLLKAEEVVELVSWISIQQMLHRLYTYFEVSEGYKAEKY